MGDDVVVEVGSVVDEFEVVGSVVDGLVIGFAVLAFELLDFESLLLLSALLFETELLLGLKKRCLHVCSICFPSSPWRCGGSATFLLQLFTIKQPMRRAIMETQLELLP